MNFKPKGNNRNALLKVAFIIEFEHEFSQEDYFRIDSKKNLWAETLPGKLIIPNDSPFQPQLGSGLVYQYFNSDGSIRQSLTLEGNKIVYFVSDYTKWDVIWPPILKILDPIYNYLKSKNAVYSFSTEYLDLFVYDGKYNRMDLSKVLRPNNGIIPSQVVDRKLNWHLHTGYFEVESDPVLHRLLTRINLDLKDNSNRNSRDLTLLLFQSIMPIHKEYTPSNEFLPDEITTKGLLNFRALHENARALLKQLLCDEMLIKIGLT